MLTEIHVLHVHPEPLLAKLLLLLLVQLDISYKEEFVLLVQILLMLNHVLPLLLEKLLDVIHNISYQVEHVPLVLELCNVSLLLFTLFALQENMLLFLMLQPLVLLIQEL